MSAYQSWLGMRNQGNGSKPSKQNARHGRRHRRMGFERLEFRRVLAAMLPVNEGFEVAARADLTDWTFSTSNGSTIDLDFVSAAHSGSTALRFDSTIDFASVSSEAILTVDLSSVATANDLSFAFWMKRLNSSTNTGYYMRADVSGDGNTWSALDAKLQPVGNVWIQYVYDLDQHLNNATITPDGDVYLRLTQFSNHPIQETIVDDVRVGQFDSIGPHVIATTPSALTAGPVSSIDVTFSEPIDTASFTGADVVIRGADGKVISLVGDPVDQTEQTTFRLNLAQSQILRGRYSIELGPAISDVAGNAMNQDQDSVNGETIGDDQFKTSFVIGPAVVQTLPYTQGFEVADLSALDGWGFYTNPTGEIDLRTDRFHSGSKSMALTSRNGETQIAQLLLDMSAQSTANDLVLDFWSMRGDSVYNSTIWASASNDGLTWFDFSTLFLPVANEWNHYFYDLDQELDANGIARDGDVYLRLNHSGTNRAYAPIDDLRIASRDGDGPYVTSISPSTVLAGPVSQIQLTFNEPIDVSTFTATDVTIIDISGNAVLISGDPMDTGDQQTFTIALAVPQTTISNYFVVLQPSLTDLSGNALNQDRDQTNGESTADRFNTTFKIGPAVAQTIPYIQDFEVADMTALAGWDFQADISGKISLTGVNGPASGAKHLLFDLTKSRSVLTDSATLVLDLSDQDLVTDLGLDYRVQRAQTEPYIPNSLTVSVSGNGTDWSALSPAVETAIPGYSNFFHDLDQAFLAASISLDGDVYIRFEHTVGSLNRWISIDDVRIARRDPVGPRIIAHSIPDVVAGVFNQFGVTFNEQIDPTSFAGNDVVIMSPLPQIPISVSSSPVDSGDQRTFTISTDQPQTQPGLYQVFVGPQVNDLDGNPMNQDQNSINGATPQDQLKTQFRIHPTPAEFPYFQGFDNQYAPGLNWYFESSSSANINFGPTAQSGSIRMENASGATSTNQAIFSIDLTGQSAVRVQFNELNLNQTSSAIEGVFISDDQGMTWFKASSAPAKSVNWQLQTIDLDAARIAAGMNYTSDFWIKIQQSYALVPPFGGRSYDDFFVERGVPISVSLNHNETEEGSAVATVLTVSRDPLGDLSNSLDFSLFSSEPSQAMMPAAGTIPIGASFIEIPVTIIDDPDVDGPQLLTLSASTLGLVPRSAELTVFDNEPATLTMSIDRNSVNESEGKSAATVTVRRNRDMTGPLVVTLTSSDESEMLAPSSVTIPAGQTTASFTIGTQNDYEIDSTQTVNLTATSPGFVDSVSVLDVLDDDTNERKTIGGRFSGALPVNAYEVLFDVDVPEAQTLTIDPGTILKFAAESGLVIYGTLLANGLPENQVIMTSLSSLPAPGDWTGIQYQGAHQPRTIIEYADIAFAKTGFSSDEVDGPLFTLKNSNLHHHSVDGIRVQTGLSNFVNSENDVVIELNTVHDNLLAGISFHARGFTNHNSFLRGKLLGNEVFANGTVGVNISSSYGTSVGINKSSFSHVIALSNQIHDNAGSGMKFEVSEGANAGLGASVSGQYSNNLIYANQGAGIEIIRSNSTQVYNNFFNNTIVENAGPGFTHSSNGVEEMTVRNNLIAFNASGIAASAAFTPVASEVAFNNVFGNTGGNWTNYPVAFGLATTNNLNGTPSDAEFNISVDPLFRAGTLYRVDYQSLVNDAGSAIAAPTTDYLAASRFVPYDIGAYEIQPAPVVQSVVVNAGQAQRSTLDRIQINFDQIIDLDQVGGEPAEIVNTDTGQPIQVLVTKSIVGNKTRLELTFDAGPSVDSNGNLAEGNYRMTLRANRIQADGVPLDGDGNAIAGDDFAFGATSADRFFRFFGDSDGDRDVDAVDYGRFAHSFLKRTGNSGFDPMFDDDSDGDVDGQDMSRFRRNLMKRI